MYLLITIVLIAATVIYAVLPKFRKVRERNTILTTFIITLVATGAGVFLALYFSNIEEKHKEKANAVKILSASRAELEGNMQRVTEAKDYFMQINDSTYTFENYIAVYKIEKTARQSIKAANAFTFSLYLKLKCSNLAGKFGFYIGIFISNIFW